MTETARRVGAAEALVEELRATSAEMKQDRDRWHAQAERLMAAQAEHVAELNAVRNQMQAALERAEQERDRLAGEVGRWVGLPWWRRLFA